MGFTNRALTSAHPGSAVVMFKIASVAIEVAARPRVITVLIVWGALVGGDDVAVVATPAAASKAARETRRTADGSRHVLCSHATYEGVTAMPPPASPVLAGDMPATVYASPATMVCRSPLCRCTRMSARLLMSSQLCEMYTHRSDGDDEDDEDEDEDEDEDVDVDGPTHHARSSHAPGRSSAT